MNQQIKIKLLPGGRMPERAHPTDACFDVFAVSREIKDGYVSYGLGFATEIPAGWAGYFYARSSISNNTGLFLCNSVGIIDADYRGEWSARFYAAPHLLNTPIFGLTTKLRDYEHGPRLYEVGDRIGQIRFAPLPLYELVEAQELTTTARGAGGFGSTGS